jgi:hypothetical protein
MTQAAELPTSVCSRSHRLRRANESHDGAHDASRLSATRGGATQLSIPTLSATFKLLNIIELVEYVILHVLLLYETKPIQQSRVRPDEPWFMVRSAVTLSFSRRHLLDHDRSPLRASSEHLG